MVELPTGTITFLFTDVEGSTRHLAALGPQFQAVLERHHKLLRGAIGRHNGVEVSTEGDSFFCVFSTAADGLAAAVDIQLSMAAEDWVDGHDVRVRIGLHTGVAARGGDNYVGMDVHRASRISEVGHGGQVLVSAATHLLGEGGLPDGVTFRDVGEFHLKDLDHAEHLYQLDIDGLQTDFPPPRKLGAGPTNLPAFTSSLVGRESQRQAIEKLFDDARLITITGVAGAGKSRLALEVASQARERFKDGIWLIEFAGVRSGELVAQVVTSAIGLQEYQGSIAVEVLIDYLRDGKHMLVFDNCEHVVEGVAALSRQLLAAAPDLTILATSRQVLGIAGEIRYPCPPLEVPDPSIESLADVLGYESVRLFELRAREVDSGFTVGEDNATVIAAICRRLDGMPLAIELAAPLVRLLTVEEILERLDHRFELLTGGPRTAPSHQQTLRAALESTFELLDEAQQEFAVRIGVFVGGFDAAAAEAVASGGDIARGDVLDALSALVDRSLVTSVQTPSGLRLTILESVRDYMWGELETRGQLEERRNAHADHFGQLVEAASSGLRGPDQDRWAARLDADIGNVRSAISFRASQGDEASLRMVDRMFLFWRRQGEWSDGLHWTRLALDSTPAGDSGLRARMLATAGFFASDLGHGGRAIADMEEGLAMARRLDDVHAIGYCSSFLGAELSRRDTDLDRGLALLSEAQRIYEEIGQPYGAAWVNRYLGLSHQERGNFDESIRLQTLSLEAFRDADDGWNIRFAQTLLAEAMHTVGELERSRDLYNESLRGSSDASFKVVVAHALKGLGKVSLAESKFGEAAENLNEALQELREIGDVACVAETRGHLAMVNLGRGHPVIAADQLHESLGVFRSIEDQGGMSWTLERLAAVALARGSLQRAAQLLGAGEAIRERSGSKRSPVDQRDIDRLLEDLRTGLGQDDVAAHQALGADLDFEAAVELGSRD
jgi:predicted ATPase/class 3 adenylate cyclase